MVLVNNFWPTFVIIVLFGVFVPVCKSHILIKGDIMVKSILKNVEKSQTESVRPKRNAVKDKKRIWKFGVIPYEIDPTAGFSKVKIAKVKAAMRQWENSTCIKFIKRNAFEHDDYIRFTKDSTICGCCSNIGKINGGQYVMIDKCTNDGLAHELGHIIGFYHEHQRPDRDEYITIKRKNVKNKMSFNRNFGKLSPNEVDTLDEPYDFDSIMHFDQAKGSRYESLGFFIQNIGYAPFQGRNWSLANISTILPKKGKNGILPKIGQHKQLSAIDIRKTNKLYKCSECGRTYFDQKGTFTSPEYYNITTNRTHQLCEWRITIMDGERIQFEINDLDIFESNDCKNDYLEVRDGYWLRSTLLGRFCGSNIPKNIVSTGNHLIINYASSHTEHRGFAANYEAFGRYSSTI